MLKKPIYKPVIVFLVLFVAAFIYLNKVFATRNVFVNVYEDYTTLSNKTDIDILFYGSSHSYTSFNPVVLDEICKTNSFNLGSASLHISLTNMMLNNTLELTNPKLIILEIYNGSLPIPKARKAKGFQLRALDITPNNSIEKYNKVKNIYSPKEYLGVYFPLIRNHTKWYEYNFFDLTRRQELNSNYLFFYRGYRGHFQELKEKTLYKDFKKVTPPKDTKVKFFNNKTKEDISNFVKTAKQKGIEVLIVTAPDLKARYNNYAFFDELNSLCEDLKTPYLNLNDYYKELDLSLNDFMDISHLNIYGGTKTTAFLANYINKHYSFTDRSSNQVWLSANKTYLDSKDLLIKTENSTYHQILGKKLIDDVIIKEVLIKKSNRKYNITISIDESKMFADDYKDLNISFKIFPYDKDKLSDKSKLKKWNFDKVDIKLKEEGSLLKFQLISKIPDIEKIEIFLYNTHKYSGVIGNKITLNNILFEKRNNNFIEN